MIWTANIAIVKELPEDNGFYDKYDIVRTEKEVNSARWDGDFEERILNVLRNVG